MLSNQLKNQLSLLQNIVSTEVESNHQLRRLVHLEVNSVPDQQILLIIQSNGVIVVRLIPKIDAQLITQPASNVTELVIIHLNAGPPLAVPILPKIQGNLTGFMVEAEHLVVEDLLPRMQVHGATEVPEAKSNKKSDLDIVRLMEAYGLSNNSPQTSLNRRVQFDDIKVIGCWV